LRFVSLFAGIGGLDLGLERAGHECVGQVEINPFSQKVLKKHWPDVPLIPDVRDFGGTEFGGFELLVAGYPCQPFSHAGKRKGLDDERNLWPHVDRIVRTVQPRFVLLENVPHHLRVGFDRVQGDLAESGYDSEWTLLSVAQFGAPHIRKRLFVLAYSHGVRREGKGAYLTGEGLPHENWQFEAATRRWQDKQSRIGLASGRNVEPGLGGTPDGIPAWVDRITGLGNTVSPEVAEWVGRRLPINPERSIMRGFS
jgi:DNA (cytosine-5)-methyltransferase 1